MLHRSRGPWLLLLVTAGTMACATIINGSSQDVAISSTPTGARVTLDGREYGVTPVVASLARKKKHTVRIDLEGFAPHELQLNQSVSGWIAGNILFGGLIGLAIDAVTGSMYNLKPDQVAAVLGAPQTAIAEDGKVLVVAVVLKPDPSWSEIGKLMPEASVQGGDR
jgi:hypothetical protein